MAFSDIFSTIQTGVVDATQQLAVQFIQGIGGMIWLLLFLVFGYIVAWFVADVILKRLLGLMKIEGRIKQVGLQDALVGFTLTGLITGFTKFYVVLMFVGSAAESFQLLLFNDVIKTLLFYIPSLLQGLAILVLALFLGDFITGKIRKSKAFPLSGLVATVIQVIIAYTAFVMALNLIFPSVDISILVNMFNLFFGALAVGSGLGIAIALGLGLKDSVAAIAKRKEKDIEKAL